MNPSQSIFPMKDQHRATESEWHCIKARGCGSKADVVAYSCILELRDRIEALEAPQSGRIDLSHLSDAEREEMLKSIANPGRLELLEVAKLPQPNHPAKPDGSLVERVAFALTGDRDGLINWKPEARAAIREVAAWMREQYGGLTTTSDLLEREAER